MCRPLRAGSGANPETCSRSATSVMTLPVSAAHAVALAATRSGLPFDVGCAHTLPDHDGVGRCQLWVGHHADHALMFVRDADRLVRFWDNGNPPLVRDAADGRGQPWIYGFPRPAWQEWTTDLPPALADPASRDPVPQRPAFAGRTVADAMLRRPKINPVTSTVADLRQLFADDHVHAALIVVDGILITLIDRADVQPTLLENTPAASLGTRSGRTVEPTAPLVQARQQLLTTDRRRLAVVDEQQRLLGLLCLRRGQVSFCSDRDVCGPG